MSTLRSKARARRVKPPPVLDGCRVLAYAFVDRDVEYAGRSNLYVGVGAKELGPVPRLAIVQRLDDRDVMLFHCDRAWKVLGVAGYPTIARAKERAARMYRGASWVKSGVSPREAAAHLRKAWKGQECSFCGRRPDQVDGRIFSGRRNVRICEICVRELAATSG